MVLPVVAFAIMTVLPAGVHRMAVSLLCVLTGLGVLMWVLSGHELVRSQSNLGGVTVQLSPLLTRISSAMTGLVLIALGLAIAPDSPLQGPATGVSMAAAAISVLSLVIGAIPQTHKWGSRNS